MQHCHRSQEVYLLIHSPQWWGKACEEESRVEKSAGAAGGLTRNPTRKVEESTNLTTLIRSRIKSRSSQPREVCRTLLSEETEFRSWRL